MAEKMVLPEELVKKLDRVLSAVEQLLPSQVTPIDWEVCNAANWRRHSFSGYLEPILDVEETELEELLGIDQQKQVVEENTRQFLSGYPANNILLWGTRGTGKSSLVRAVLNRYATQGLRVIQVDKNDLIHLPEIFSTVCNLQYRFILLCDDLSFEQGEINYKILKSALDGSVYAAPKNVLIYTTSNRRHLLPEYETDNLGAKMVKNEIHHGESVEEKISLSDRFGLWVSFQAFSQAHYLQVVEQSVQLLSKRSGMDIEWTEEIRKAAVRWSHDKSKRCGRTALQFARHWVGQTLLKERG